MRINKIVFACLTTIFLLSECNPMKQQLATNLGDLKNSLGQLKEKLESLGSKMKNLHSNLSRQKRQIEFGGSHYGTSEYWNFSKLEKYVTTHNFEPFKQKAAFNVIERGKLGDEETAFNTLVGNPKYNGAVFQVAANDNVSWMWKGGGVQAGYFVDATKLGSITRSKSANFMDSFFAGSPLPQKSGHLTLCTTGKDPLDINNIFINIHSDLEIKDNLVQDKAQKQIIHASITAGYSGGRNSASKIYGQEDGIKIAQNCLIAGYEGTLLAAILLRSPTVVLTFLGCHAFSNDPKDVFNAIAQAVRTYVKKYNLNVTAYLDDTTKFSEEDDQNFMNLRKEINGKDENIDPTPK